MIDQRVFELACGGVLVGILTTGTVAKIPIFSKTVPERRDKPSTDTVVVACRDSINDEFLRDWEDSPLMKRFYLDGILSFIIICDTGRFSDVVH